MELFNITAGAFKVPCPNDISHKNFDQLLNEYAIFTKRQAQSAPKDKASVNAIQQGLFMGAKAMGTRFKRELWVKNFDDFRIAVRAVYRALAIDLSCNKAGEVLIKKCFFSAFYSGSDCSLISSLDAGLIAGLSGGLKLDFHQRITENNGYCAARIIQ